MSDLTKTTAPDPRALYKITNAVFSFARPNHSGIVKARPGKFSDLWYAVDPATGKVIGGYGKDCFTIVS